MSSVLDRLETVSAAEANNRHRVAANLRGAFIQREERVSIDSPIAAHFLLSEMCARAKQEYVGSCSLHDNDSRKESKITVTEPWVGTPPVCLS